MKHHRPSGTGGFVNQRRPLSPGRANCTVDLTKLNGRSSRCELRSGFGPVHDTHSLLLSVWLALAIKPYLIPWLTPPCATRGEWVQGEEVQGRCRGKTMMKTPWDR